MLKTRSLIILVIVLAALGAISLIQSLSHRKATSRSNTSPVLSGDLTSEDLNRIEVGYGLENGVVVLEKLPDSWVVRSAFSHKANQSRVDNLLRNLSDLQGEFRSDSPQVLADYGFVDSTVINIAGYIGMAQSRAIADIVAGWGCDNPGYWVFLAAACLIGFGTAIFKPPVHGTIAKTTTEENSSMGWGVFYWVVNIGGALAPMCAAQLRGEINWHYVFYGAAIVTACNFIPLFLLYREPAKSPPKEGEQEKGPLGTFASSIATIFKDPRLVVFLLIFSCFWLMFMQLWDLLPNFIDEWVDTSDVAPVFAFINQGWVLENGQTKPEMLININSLSIIALVLFVSWLIGRINWPAV